MQSVHRTKLINEGWTKADDFAYTKDNYTIVYDVDYEKPWQVYEGEDCIAETYTLSGALAVLD